MCLVTTPLKRTLRLKEIPIHECGPDCLCWQLIEMAGGQTLPPGFPFDTRRSPRNLEALERARLEPIPSPPQAYAPNFNAEEVEILRLIRDGMSNREIAVSLPLTSLAVSQKIRLLLIKLDLRTREQLAIYYATHRLTVSPV